MSEQYRCSECGHFVEIPDDAICDVCNIGIMQHLRYTKGGDGSHWDGCEEVHWDCRIAQLEAELARRDEKIAELRNDITGYRRTVVSQNEIIARLKEDAERLADGMIISPENEGDFCSYCGGMEHVDDCPITLHRALMKEVE